VDAAAETRTFVFTDIEGSTRLWQQHPAAMADVLVRHDAIVRTTIHAGGGHLFKHTGDGCCAAFVDAGAALAAAIALQQALATAAWGDGPRPTVRVAIDSGPAWQRDGDYFGPTLNRTARILAVGWGGQVLATASSLGQAPAAETVDLGQHRLRDLGEPIRLYQVLVPGLPGTFPPLRSLERFRHNLPIVRSSFVGRESEIARIRSLLDRARVLTITGVGGCGKTRLALAVASQELERYVDGAFFVDLSVVTDPALVWSALAAAVGAGSTAGLRGELPPRAFAIARLADAKALVILDNCEHLLDAAADVAAALVDALPTVTVVVTSREPLGIEGEHVVRVPSLALPGDAPDAGDCEAVRLFVERASTGDATFEPTPPIMATVAEICRRLDGIPLAIELAAARVRHISPAEIAQRLDDRFRLLTGGPRGARQRQQTLAATLDWSFQLLTERERMLLRRLAVFVGGFPLDAVEHVCAGDDLPETAIVDALGALVDKSLVSLHAAERRYRLLETIRLYALDRLVEAGEVATTRTRHLAWFARRYARPDDEADKRLDQDNIRVAREWANHTGQTAEVARLTVALFARASDAFAATEERAWCDEVLAYELDPALRADVLTVAGFRDVGAGDWDRAIARTREAIAVAPALGEGMVAGAYAPLAIALMVTDPDAAERVIDEGIAAIRRAQAPAFSQRFLESLKVGTALMRGDAASAAAWGRRAGAEPEADNGMTFGVAFALHLLGRHDEADADARRRPSVTRSTGYGDHARSILHALTAAARGRWDDAGRELARAAEHVRRHRYPLTLNDCIVACGALAALADRHERACTLLAAVADRGFVRSPDMWAVYLHYRAIVRGRIGADVVRRCRDAARSIEYEAALDEELAWLASLGGGGGGGGRKPRDR
jgi:predicted ATPase/class 3 adenylate cyclase